MLETTGTTGPDDTGCQTWYPDLDLDGFGNPAHPNTFCYSPEGWVQNGDDCDDEDGSIHPEADEICNIKDDDCDDNVDEQADDAPLWYADTDGDGFGDPENSVSECDGGTSYVADATDCDDDDPLVNPEAEEVCEDGQDNDCDGDDLYCGFGGQMNLSDADAKLWASTAGYDAGRRIDSFDMDGDGDDEVVVSAMWANGYQGGAYLLDGPFDEDRTLDEAGIWLAGDAGTYEGARALGVAEGTGDGLGDVLMGAPDAPGYDAVVVFGPIFQDTTFTMADLRFSCDASIECGHGADFADVNGDGIADAVIGAGEQTHGGSSSGSVYVIYAPLVAMTADLDSAADAEFVGEYAGIETGRVVMAGGDLNGDGIGDILASASYDSDSGSYAGSVLVNYGPAVGVKDMSDADGKLLGEHNYDYSGEIIGMGDVNGDGLSDSIVTSFLSDNYAGAVYVVFGPSDGRVYLGDADVKIRGGINAQLGTAVVARDIDGDDVADLLMGSGSSSEHAPGAGAAHLFFGPVTGTYTASDADASFYGEDSSSGAGGGVGQADVDGDGFGELLIGAPGEDTGGRDAGALYVLFSRSVALFE